MDHDVPMLVVERFKARQYCDCDHGLEFLRVMYVSVLCVCVEISRGVYRQPKGSYLVSRASPLLELILNRYRCWVIIQILYHHV